MKFFCLRFNVWKRYHDLLLGIDERSYGWEEWIRANPNHTPAYDSTSRCICLRLGLMKFYFHSHNEWNLNERIGR